MVYPEVVELEAALAVVELEAQTAAVLPEAELGRTSKFPTYVRESTDPTPFRS